MKALGLIWSCGPRRMGIQTPPVTHYTQTRHYAPSTFWSFSISSEISSIIKKTKTKKQWIRGVSVLDSAADAAAYNDFLSPKLASNCGRLETDWDSGLTVLRKWQGTFAITSLQILYWFNVYFTVKAKDSSHETAAGLFFLAEGLDSCIWLQTLVLKLWQVKTNILYLYSV